MTADEVKDALRRRHPTTSPGGIVGQWVCIEEWDDVDLLALSAWSDGSVVAYEVKVSRGDMRSELLAPRKREDAVSMSTEFYFAVPRGLLTADELAYEEPEWEPGDFARTRCPGLPEFGPERYTLRSEHRRYGGACRGRGRTGTHKAGVRERGPFRMRLPLPLVIDVPEHVTTRWTPDGRVPREADDLARTIEPWAACRLDEEERAVLCPRCGGKGYLERSRVEREAPTLWVPRDVGLIEVDGRACRVTRRSPKRPDAPGLLPIDASERVPMRLRRQRLHKIVRWTSYRPDPRHAPALRWAG